MGKAVWKIVCFDFSLSYINVLFLTCRFGASLTLVDFPSFFSFCCLPGYSYQSTIYFSPNGVIIPARCRAAKFFARAARFLSVQATSAHNYLVARDINEGRVTWKVELLIQRNINSLDWKSKFSSLIHILGAQLKKKEKKLRI